MITIENSIPTKSDKFLKGIDIFYVQFNDVNFYIEDEDQENFYFEIFRKLFPEVQVKKIFPLNGKDNVLTESKKSQNLSNNKKVYIVDKDFDDLLNREVKQPNLFYLKKYSIENYLIENDCIKDYVIEEKPKLKVTEINRIFKCKDLIKEAGKLYYDIVLLYLIVQNWKLDLKNTSLAPEKFIQFGNPIALRTFELQKYENEIQIELHNIDRRLTVSGQIRKTKRNFNLKNWAEMWAHIPGKYLVRFFKAKIETLFALPSRNIDSLIFRLAKNNKFMELKFLKDAVESYIK